MGQFVSEGQVVGFRGEVVHLLAPVRHRVGDALNELPDAALALRRPDVAAEVLAGYDIGGELSPALGDVDVMLFEDDVALLAGDDRAALFPLHSGPDVLSRLGEVP